MDLDERGHARFALAWVTELAITNTNTAPVARCIAANKVRVHASVSSVNGMASEPTVNRSAAPSTARRHRRERVPTRANNAVPAAKGSTVVRITCGAPTSTGDPPWRPGTTKPTSPARPTSHSARLHAAATAAATAPRIQIGRRCGVAAVSARRDVSVLVVLVGAVIAVSFELDIAFSCYTTHHVQFVNPGADGQATVTINHPTNARSRRTRDALLAGARAILERDGFQALTMGAVAREAGVTRGAVYLHFASRSDLVAALFDHVAQQQGLAESLAPVWNAPDSVAALDQWAAHLARYHPALIPVDRAITQVQGHDTDAAEHRQRVSTAQRSGCARLAQRLADEGRLSQPWTVDTATDMLYALISTDMIERLMVDCDWEQTQLAEHLSAMFKKTFAD